MAPSDLDSRVRAAAFEFHGARIRVPRSAGLRPNREFLAGLAQATGGREFTDAASLADALAGLSIAEGEQTVRRTPLWSREWLLGALLGLLAAEWFLRRWLGLA